MDNLTHTLAAVAISKTGLNLKTRFATLTLILAANAPDIDVLASLRGSVAYLKYHRGISHSFLGVFVLAILIWAVVYALGKRARPKPGLPLNARWLLLAAFLGTGSHLLLDFTNAYGVRPFLPFSGRWYAWDIMPILDPLLWVLLVVGLAVPWLLRLISEEVGARKPRWLYGAVFCLGAMVVLWAVRDFAHSRALSMLDERTYSDEAPQRFSAFPVAVNPFVWTGVVETATAFHVERVNALDVNALPEEMRSFEKPSASPALSAAMKAPAARVFLDFARYPWAQMEQNEDGYQIGIRDLRFYRPSERSSSFVLKVELDKNLRTRFEAFYFAAPRPHDQSD